MAVTQFAFGRFRIYDRQTPQAITAANATFEVKTPSGSSSATTAAAGTDDNICRVSTDTAVYVAFGTSPTASSTTGFLLPAGSTDYFVVSPTHKAAVITA